MASQDSADPGGLPVGLVLMYIAIVGCLKALSSMVPSHLIVLHVTRPPRVGGDIWDKRCPPSSIVVTLRSGTHRPIPCQSV